MVTPTTAAERKGIQPVVTVKADGAKRAEIKVGGSVHLTAETELPAGR